LSQGIKLFDLIASSVAEKKNKKATKAEAKIMQRTVNGK
jgi:hypothetical protein